MDVPRAWRRLMWGAGGQKRLIEASPVERMRTTDEVASAAEFLLGPEGSIITGADLRMDGGDIAALRAGRLQVNVSRKDGQRQQMTRVVATSLKNRA